MKYLYASVAMAALTIGAPVAAQTAGGNVANTIFLVDESGSMAGEQTFLEQFVLDIDPALKIAGFTERNYGLMGFAGPGTGPANLREFTVGTGQLGTAQEFKAAAQGLVTTGGTEDGYAAIDAALGSYPIGGGATFVLVTDEDRDDTDATLTFGSIRDAMNAAGVNLAAMLDVTIKNVDGDNAISTDGQTALTQDGATFTSIGFDQFTGGDGDTIAHYADLALATNGGCVADLNQLRAGGDAAAAFAAAFQTCVINAATESGIVAILAIPIRDATMTVAQDIRHKLRLLAQAMPSDNGDGSSVLSTQGQVIDEMFNIAGLRGYANLSGTTGSLGGGNDLESHTITAGMDYTFDAGAARARFGGALSFQDGDISGNNSRLGMDTTQASFYGVYRLSTGLQFSGDVQIGDTDSNTRRVVGATTVTGNTDSDYRAIGLEAGHRFDLSGTNGVVMPYGGLRHERIEQDRYTESNGGVVPGYSQVLSSAAVGVRYEIDTVASFGAVETIVDASLNHIFSEDLNVGTGTVALAPGNVDDNRLEIGVNFAVETAPNSRVSLNLSGTRSKNVSTATLGVGFQMSF